MHKVGQLLTTRLRQRTTFNLLNFFKLGIISELVMGISWMLVAITLYDLFKTVNRTLKFAMAGMAAASGGLILWK